MRVQTESIIVDTSVAIKWISSENEPLLAQAKAVLIDMRKNDLTLFMPELAKYEVGNALRYKNISPEKANKSLAVFYKIPVTFVSDDQHAAGQILTLAHESDITYYDAAFIYLARHLVAPLITANPKHHTKYKGKDVTIIPLEKYK